MDNLEDRILKEASIAVSEAIVKVLSEYHGPLRKLVDRVIVDNNDDLYKLINTEYAALINCVDFKEQLKIALNAKLARTLIARMGGELESQVNKLKADPVTRSKITIAIDKVISDLGY